MERKSKWNSLSLFLVFFVFHLLSCIPELTTKKHKDLEIPNAYPEELSEEVQLREKNLPEEIWSEFYKEPYLINSIQYAIENNQELSILEQEISIANNEILSRYGEYLPKLSLQGDLGIEKTERFSTPDANSPTRFTRGGVVMSWEVDIWKRLRNATQSAYLQYLATIEGRRYVVTNLVAEVASTYYEVLAYRTQVQRIEEYIQVLEKIQNTVSLLRQAGRTTSLAVQRFDAEVEKFKARQFELRQSLALAENRFHLLLGRFPEPIPASPREFLTIELPRIQSSVPVKLLENRPDLRKASLMVEARKLDVEVARARFYPSLTIDGNAGYEAFNSKHFEGTSIDVAYKLAAGITMPLLNRRAIEASYKTANNLQIQAVYDYEMTLLKAFTEVTNQLARLKNLKGKLERKQKQVEALENSVKIADTLFRAARTDYIEVLLAQRDLIEAEIELIEIKKDQLDASIGLYKALGGGWKGHNSL